MLFLVTIREKFGFCGLGQWSSNIFYSPCQILYQKLNNFYPISHRIQSLLEYKSEHFQWNQRSDLGCIKSGVLVWENFITRDHQLGKVGVELKDQGCWKPKFNVKVSAKLVSPMASVSASDEHFQAMSFSWLLSVHILVFLLREMAVIIYIELALIT